MNAPLQNTIDTAKSSIRTTDESRSQATESSHYVDYSGATEQRVEHSHIDIESKIVALMSESSHYVDYSGATEQRVEHSHIDIGSKIVALMSESKHEELEDGFENSLSREMGRFVTRYGVPAVEAIHDILRVENFRHDLLAELLKEIGRVEHRLSHNYRRWLLETMLVEANGSELRDAANVGLAHMDDPHAISAFDRAIDSEEDETLRRFLQQTREQLKSKLR